MTNDAMRSMQLVVMMRPEVAFRASARLLEPAAGENTSGIEQLLRRNKASMAPPFGLVEERITERLRLRAEVTRAPMEDTRLID